MGPNQKRKKKGDRAGKDGGVKEKGVAVVECRERLTWGDRETNLEKGERDTASQNFS